MKDIINIVICSLVVVLIIILVSFSSHKMLIKKIDKCEPSRVIRIEPVGHRYGILYSCFLENGGYGTCDNYNYDITVGDMGCLIDGYVYNKQLNYQIK